MGAGSASAAGKTETLRVFSKTDKLVLTHADGTVVETAPFPEAVAADRLDIYASDFAGNHAKHAKVATGSEHVVCTFTAASPEPDCISHVALGGSLLIFRGFPGTLIGGAGRYLGATGKVLSNKAAVTDATRWPLPPSVGGELGQSRPRSRAARTSSPRSAGAEPAAELDRHRDRDSGPSRRHSGGSRRRPRTTDRAGACGAVAPEFSELPAPADVINAGGPGAPRALLSRLCERPRATASSWRSTGTGDGGRRATRVSLRRLVRRRRCGCAGSGRA